jgi:hypothetical protein
VHLFDLRGGLAHHTPPYAGSMSSSLAPASPDAAQLCRARSTILASGMPARARDLPPDSPQTQTPKCSRLIRSRQPLFARPAAIVALIAQHAIRSQSWWHVRYAGWDKAY